MLRQPASRIFLLVVLLMLLVALFGPRIGLIGCDSYPELSFGPCKVGTMRPQ